MMRYEFANVGIPVVVIILAAIWNKSDNSSLKKEFLAQIAELRTQLTDGLQRIENRLLVLEGEVRSLHSLSGESRGKIEILEKQILRK